MAIWLVPKPILFVMNVSFVCGEGHICENTKVIGVDTDGCFARYVKIPEHNCFINSPTMNPLHLSVQEPLGNAVHTIAHFDVNNKDVVILGCGPIGLMGVDVAKALGAKKSSLLK